MNFILRLKNWQLFLIILLVPWMTAIGIRLLIPVEYIGSNYLINLLTVFYYLVFVFWNYKVILTFNKFEKALTERQIRRLKWLLIVLIIYMFYLLLPVNYRFENILISSLSPIIMLVSAFSIFYMIFCTAKTLKYIQLKDQIRTSDIIVEMFVIFYFPIGVLWLQRKVNNYYKKKNDLSA